jgi:CDGSH-type Zn-finger protein
MPEPQRIEIQPDGPYRVVGDIPLRMASPVHTFNGEPIAWHSLGDIPAPPETYDLCRCGQSASKPFCDLTHEEAGFDGTETADRRPYRDRASRTRRKGEVVADDKSICIFAGFCRTRTTSIPELFASDRPGDHDRMKEMVWNCPSGRYVLYDSEGFAVEPPFTPAIVVTPGGPLWVQGGVEVVGADGQVWETRNRVTLCRCGQSRNKPYCDGTHLNAHFDER